VRVDAEWITSPAARRILVHFADPRPAWLWGHDGDTLLWRNPAAKLFNGRIKKHGLKLSPGAVPIKGQVARLIRLGAMGRASLSRVQMLAGDKPLSVTCSCTPLQLIDGELALLLVALDPVPAELREAAGGLVSDAMSEALFPVGVPYRLVGPEAADDSGGVRLAAGPDGATLVFGTAEPPPSIAEVRAEEGIGAEEPPPAEDPAPPAEEPAPAAEQPEEPGALSALFDRLAGDAELYTPLGAADETFAGEPPAPDVIADVIAAEEAEPPAAEAPEEAPPHTHWQITGRGFRALPPAPESEPAPAPEAEPPAAAPEAGADLDTDTADRVTRYNFEELGRLLSDRVAGEPPAEAEPDAPPPAPPAGIINLNAETLVLNRLPLAILVFRDQQVLFANRALTDLLGYDSVGRLREAGIAAIFPSGDAAHAGPVNRLVRRDGTALAVTARLQSVSWQGRAALMLSASGAEPATSHEGAIRAFAELAAAAREEGFIAADRAGIVTAVSGTGRLVLGKEEPELVGKPLATLVGRADLAPLRTFLEQPARFAETARPALVVGSDDGGAEIALFAEGQAGIVSGYFGFIRSRAPALPIAAEDTADPGLLGRLSRGIRRPLNTIIGFADLIRSAASGAGPDDRTAEYAGDIRTAGLEIAVLADELDDFTRLKEGHYAPRPADLDLGALLESCMVRVRAQAGAARVLVRSAISERLPRIRADRASLGQALLNLLASAIDQTPIGGSVILSAQAGEDGSIAIHVRDGAQNGTDLGERFVVFRDGVSKDGEQLAPVRSSVGLALTRSLLAVNACSLSVDPTVGTGTLFSLLIPAELVAKPQRL
jgi:PAS domain-containing protein